MLLVPYLRITSQTLNNRTIQYACEELKLFAEIHSAVVLLKATLLGITDNTPQLKD
jgi:hypothetical protein